MNRVPFHDTSLKNNVMTLTGKGSVTAIPDLAILRLGVLTTGFNLSDAQTENARISQAVLQVLQEMGITDIKTFQYTIEKLYDYENGNRIDRGYSVRNILEIRTDQLDQVGEIIDNAVSNGANIVELISFEVSEVDEYYLEALNEAVMNAYEKARSIALNLGLSLSPVPFRINETSSVPIPFSPTFALREGAYTTPIEPGSKQIEAMVTIEFIFQ